MPQRRKNRFYLIMTSMLVSFFVLSLLLSPEECYNAAADGVNIWFTTVFPALLPFFIGAELLIGLGVIDFMGALLEPFMRPVFKAPGIASFVYILSITSGYPVGVKLTCKMRQEKMCSRTEGQRMLAFCSTSGPLFMIGAVAVGMLHSAPAGTVIAVSHYISSIIVGVCFSFFLKDTNNANRMFTGMPAIKTGLEEMYRRRLRDGRPFGVLMGDAVRESVNTLLVIGGFITVFSVVINIFSITGIIDLLSRPFVKILNISRLPSDLVKPVISGLLEITIGSRQISLVPASFISKIVAVSFIIGWSGFSIHAQAASFISKTDLSTSIYVLSKILHGILASIISYILGIFMLTGQTQQVFGPEDSLFSYPAFVSRLIFSTKTFFIQIFILIFTIVLCKLIGRIFGFKIKRN